MTILEAAGTVILTKVIIWKHYCKRPVDADVSRAKDQRTEVIWWRLSRGGWGAEQWEVAEGEGRGGRAERAGTSCGKPAGGGPGSPQCGTEAGVLPEMGMSVPLVSVRDVNPSYKLQSTGATDAFRGLSCANQRGL